MADQATNERVAPNDYEAIGGGPAVRAVVNTFYERVLADERLTGKFSGVDLAALKKHQVQLISHVLGGPVEYEGRDLRDAHAGLAIRPSDFSAVVEHLVAVLREAQVPDEIVDRVVQALAGAERDIVTAGEG